MLRLEGVTYRYAGTEAAALTGVDLELHDGDVVGVVGPSESGKSTLCLVASGLAPRAIRGHLQGRLIVDGEDVAAEPMHALAARVGIAFQDPANQLSGVTGSVFEEVAFGAMNLGLPLAEVAGRTHRALEALGIANLAERDPWRLSGGQMQLVALAGLLAMGPRHLVLDEPTAQLDPHGTRLVADALSRLAAEGSSILLAEQKTDLVAAVCQRVAVLDRGRLVHEGDAASALGDPLVRDLGVAEPAPVRLARVARERRVAIPAGSAA